MKELGLLFKVLELQDRSTFTTLFQGLEKLVYYSYFRVNKEYYLFTFAKSRILEKIILNFLYAKLTILENITARQRRFRSLRGFCLYILDLIKAGKNFEVLQTNLNDNFWDDVRIIIRYKNKYKLDQYLFKFDEKEYHSDSFVTKNFELPIKSEFEINNGCIILKLNY